MNQVEYSQWRQGNTPDIKQTLLRLQVEKQNFDFTFVWEGWNGSRCREGVLDWSKEGELVLGEETKKSLACLPDKMKAGRGLGGGGAYL